VEAATARLCFTILQFSAAFGILSEDDGGRRKRCSIRDILRLFSILLILSSLDPISIYPYPTNTKMISAIARQQIRSA
jgi:hypothetical protein